MGYEDKLRELKTAFLEGVALQTEITVVRMMNAVVDVGRPVPYGCYPMLTDRHHSGVQRPEQHAIRIRCEVHGGEGLPARNSGVCPP